MTAIEKINKWIKRGKIDEMLDLSHFELDELPELPYNVRRLKCTHNKLTHLPNPLPENLIHLECSNNKITEFGNLPYSLRFLLCSFNELTELPNPLPPLLIYLFCSNNLLTNLPPKLPTLLESLDCASNKLRKLPDPLPETLKTLICMRNKLTHLPNIPPQLSYLNCSYNQITYLPPFPKTLTTIIFKHNKIFGGNDDSESDSREEMYEGDYSQDESDGVHEEDDYEEAQVIDYMTERPFMLEMKHRKYFLNKIRDPKISLTMYTGDEYVDINTFLRAEPEDRAVIEDEILVQTIYGIDYLFSKADRFTSDTVLYRGFKGRTIPEGGFIENGYMSTTTSFSIGKGFAKKCCLYKLTVDAGIPFIDIDNGKEGILHHAYEQEILLPRGLKIVPTGTAELKDGTTIYFARVSMITNFDPPEFIVGFIR